MAKQTREAVMQARASESPCPWCGHTTGFVDSDESIIALLKDYAAIWVRFRGLHLTDVDLAALLALPKGCEAMCSGCRKFVHICPKCYEPQQTTDESPSDTCPRCRTLFVC